MSDVQLRFSMPGTFAAVAKARRRVAEWLGKAGAEPRALGEVGLALTEICNNAVEHGTANAKRPLHLAAAIEADAVVIEFLGDHGGSARRLDESFAWASPPAATSERGRGLFLIKACVDDLRVDATSDGRLRIRMRKRIR